VDEEKATEMVYSGCVWISSLACGLLTTNFV